MAWCPPEKLAEFKYLRRKMSFDDAKRLIESDLSPFDRKLQAVRNGAPLIHVRPIRRAASSFSETGISTVYECG